MSNALLCLLAYLLPYRVWYRKNPVILVLFLFLTDVESTGSSNEFYDKFSIRYHISIIMKSLWVDLGHRQAIMKQSR